MASSILLSLLNSNKRTENKINTINKNIALLKKQVSDKIEEIGNLQSIIQSSLLKLVAGNNIHIDENGVISAFFNTDNDEIDDTLLGALMQAIANKQDALSTELISNINHIPVLHTAAAESSTKIGEVSTLLKNFTDDYSIFKNAVNTSIGETRKQLIDTITDISTRISELPTLTSTTGKFSYNSTSKTLNIIVS